MGNKFLGKKPLKWKIYSVSCSKGILNSEFNLSSASTALSSITTGNTPYTTVYF